eukprot:TRINITY_DN509_c0_g1_i2.p1 TRINITY_DN509_c0_g1~~TRINITY_DN509_c0_g1_i2.p1  ORF type:complete len:507 (-),score=169.76 TRINITY_DN509_c0_g1_i2:858-2378(-)
MLSCFGLNGSKLRSESLNGCLKKRLQKTTTMKTMKTMKTQVVQQNTKLLTSNLQSHFFNKINQKIETKLSPFITINSIFSFQKQQKQQQFKRFYAVNSKKQIGYDLVDFPQERIRNFSIVAHVDAGKTTLSNRILEYTSTIPKQGSDELYLDKLQVEKERGITVKAQTASMFYKYENEVYLLNLIDTPGHVDFAYEVSRSLSACSGAILIVDGTQGIQAQTLANYYLSIENNLEIIPVINKIDLSSAQPQLFAEEIENVLGLASTDCLMISAKTGSGIEELFEAIVKRVPIPEGDSRKTFRGLLFDSWFDVHRGVVCVIKVVDGSLKKGDKITSIGTKKEFEVFDIGILHPEQISTGALYTGQVGWFVAGIRNVGEARIGDTFHLNSSVVTPLPGFKPLKSMVFASLYPGDGEKFEVFGDAIAKLTLNDASVTARKENNEALGVGFRCGFLGVLHMDVFLQRLEQEYSISVIPTVPSVPYKVLLNSGEEIEVQIPSLWPAIDKIKE